MRYIQSSLFAGIIKAEKAKVDSDVKTTQNQVEVRNITKKISDLNCKLDTVSTLSEPRENSYIEYYGNFAGIQLFQNVYSYLASKTLGESEKTLNFRFKLNCGLDYGSWRVIN